MRRMHCPVWVLNPMKPNINDDDDGDHDDEDKDEACCIYAIARLVFHLRCNSCGQAPQKNTKKCLDDESSQSCCRKRAQ